MTFRMHLVQMADEVPENSGEDCEKTFRDLRSCWGQHMSLFFYRIFWYFSIENFRCWKQRANPSI